MEKKSGKPTVRKAPEIRTEKEVTQTHPVLPELEVRIPESWVSLIYWCQTNLRDGQLCIKTVNGEPTDLIPEHTLRRIRFDKKATVPLDFDMVNWASPKG